MPVRSLIDSFRQIGSPKRYAQGRMIIPQGDVPRSVSVVTAGIVRAYIITPEGGEQTVTLYGPGDMFPFAWAFGQATKALYFYEALSDVELLTVSKEDFLAEIDNNQESAQAFTRLLSKHYAALLFRITGLVQSRAIEKVAYTFYYLTTRYGTELSPTHYQIDLVITQAMLATLIGQSRESTTRNIKELRKRNIVQYKNSRYVVDKSRLESFLGEDSFAELDLQSA